MGDYALAHKILSTDPQALNNVPSQEVLLTMAFLDGLFGDFADRTRIILLFLERGIRVSLEYLEELAGISQSLGCDDLAKTIRAYRLPS